MGPRAAVSRTQDLEANPDGLPTIEVKRTMFQLLRAVRIRTDGGLLANVLVPSSSKSCYHFVDFSPLVSRAPGAPAAPQPDSCRPTAITALAARPCVVSSLSLHLPAVV